MNRKLLKITLIILIVMIGVSTFFQIKVESYKTELTNSYSLFTETTRKGYKPFVFFYLESKFLKKNKKCWTSMVQMYEKNEIFKNARREANNSYKIIFNIEYNAYLIYCFYGSEGYKKS